MRIVVVGGVAGGMSCAARARRLDEHAEVVVLERGEHVSFAGCGLPYHVGGDVPQVRSLLVQTPQSLADALGLDVRPRHEVVAVDTVEQVVTVRTADGEEALGYDALVLAPGARPVVPAALVSGRVHTLRTVEDAVALRARVASGARRAVVLGAGFVGLEAAEALQRQGLRVTLVERAAHVLAPLEPELAALVARELTVSGVDVRTGVGATRVEPGPDADVVLLDDGARITADLVVLALGVRPDSEVARRAGIVCDEDGAIVVDEHGRTSTTRVWAVGDAVASVDAVTGVRRPVTLAGPANRAGRLVADDILRPGAARRLPAPVGTAVVRVGGLTAAVTGASRRALVGTPVHTVHLHPTQHVGWFPGAAQVHLVAHLRADDGVLLGAQAVGTDGVDKRIDVLATAIRAGMTADDLIDLDLAYAPPYGQAKDPVNLVGMVAENVLSGVTRLWYAEEVDRVLDEALVLDVRSAAEFATGHLPGALNVPHTVLRGRLHEVRRAAAGRPVRVLCASGVRSHLAHRLLVQEGLDSASLSGGMLTLVAALGPRAEALLRPAPLSVPV